MIPLLFKYGGIFKVYLNQRSPYFPDSLLSRNFKDDKPKIINKMFLSPESESLLSTQNHLPAGLYYTR